MNEFVIKIIAAVIGTLGFTLIFNLRLKHIPFALLDGLVAVVVYLFAFDIFSNYFISNILAAFVTAVFADIFARAVKAPSTVFLIPGCIVLVPGGNLYYSMSYLISQKFELAAEQLLLTVEIGIAIGGGIIAASLVRYIFNSFLSLVKSKRKKK